MEKTQDRSGSSELQEPGDILEELARKGVGNCWRRRWKLRLPSSLRSTAVPPTRKVGAW